MQGRQHWINLKADRVLGSKDTCGSNRALKPSCPSFGRAAARVYCRTWCECNSASSNCAGAGNSIFFTVRKIEDPIGLLPPKLILGINKRGVHFFRPVPKEYLHSAELRDIMQFGSSSQAVFFKMRVAGVLHIFQFDTRQGEDICMALQTHINDIMMKRYSKVSCLLQQPVACFSFASGRGPSVDIILRDVPCPRCLSVLDASMLLQEELAIWKQYSSLCLKTDMLNAEQLCRPRPCRQGMQSPAAEP